MDNKAKRDRVEAIDDEVKELHPLLNSIFQRLSHVSYVEYTHGPNEMGADFVIERVDADIGSHHYVGVVAKTEKILQNFSDIERQIDECALSRFIRQGKESVRLSEIWVITSKTVSHNAKQKIHEKYAARTIHFFDGDWLTQRIDEHAPYFWEQLSGAIGTYLSNIDKRVSIINTQTQISTGTSAAVTIDIDVEEVESDKYSKGAKGQKLRLVNISDEILSNKITLLEANMGFGKSHLARTIVSHFAEIAVYKSTKVIPIYSSFKSFMDGKDFSLGNFIEKCVGAECLADCIEDQALYLVILDGIDEASSNFDDCKACLEAIIADAKQRPNTKLFLTSRPLKAFDDMGAAFATAKRYRIRPLSVSKIIAYLKRVFAARSLPNKLLDDLGKSDLFRQLPQNPIAASLLANLVAQDKYELPSNLTELYSKTMELMMGRWDERRQISTEKLYKATERLARHLARHMIDNELIYMSKNEVRQMFDRFLSERNIGVPVDDAFDYLVNRSNLFGAFDDTDALFFRHRSFAEYLYARDAYETRNFQVNDRAFHPYWSSTFFFYIGSLGECPDLLASLAQMQPTEEAARFLKLINMGNYLLAGYQTPYSTIQDSLDIIMIEAARLFVDVREGRAMSPLIELSEMQLLWLFAMSIRQCYGYKFFEKGLPYAMAKIDESILDNQDVKTHALFFAASALNEVDNNCGFEFLLTKRKAQELPLGLSLALRAELEYAGRAFANLSVVKQYERKLKKLLYTDVAGRIARDAKIDSLFKEPIGNRFRGSNAGKTKALAGSREIKAPSSRPPVGK